MRYWLSQGMCDPKPYDLEQACSQSQPRVNSKLFLASSAYLSHITKIVQSVDLFVGNLRSKTR